MRWLTRNQEKARKSEIRPDHQTGDWGEGTMEPVYNPSSLSPDRPMQSYNGLLGLMVDGSGAPNTIGHYANDYDHTPITFSRFATRWGDMQLKNGLANGVGSGKIWGYRGEGWYDNVVPTIPGQTRLIGNRLPGNFPAKGPAPSQWQANVNAGPGSQPMYPGGPGQVASTMLENPGSGG